MTRMLELTALVQPETFDAIKALSERSKLSMSHHVRAAIVALVQRVERDFADLRGIDDMKTFALAAQQRMWSAPLFALKRNKVESLAAFMKLPTPITCSSCAARWDGASRTRSGSTMKARSRAGVGGDDRGRD